MFFPLTGQSRKLFLSLHSPFLGFNFKINFFVLMSPPTEKNKGILSKCFYFSFSLNIFLLLVFLSRYSHGIVLYVSVLIINLLLNSADYPPFHLARLPEKHFASLERCYCVLIKIQIATDFTI
jgi:hypothetical protein